MRALLIGALVGVLLGPVLVDSVLVDSVLVDSAAAAGVESPAASRVPGRLASPPGSAGSEVAQPALGAVGTTADVAPRGEFGWPLPGFPSVLRGFDPPDHPYGPGHRGVDLGGYAGQPVLAAGAGVVVFAGMVAGRPVISVDHPNGLRTTYEPVLASVSAGQPVARGQRIGTLQTGHDGCLAAACLHWGVRRGHEYLEPLWLLAHGRVRLLPCCPDS